MTVALGADDPNDCYGPDGPDNLPAAFGLGSGAGVSWVNAEVFDEGTYDYCNAFKFTVRRQAPYSDVISGLNQMNGHVPCNDISPDFPSEFERAISEQDSIKFYCGEAGSVQTVILRAYQVDANGNIMVDGFGNPIYSECQIEVTVADKVKPICPANVTVACEDFDHSFAAYAPTDNCCMDTVIVLSIDSTLFSTACSVGTLSRTFEAVDCSGNSSTCSQQIVVTATGLTDYVRFPDDVIAFGADPNANYGVPTFFGVGCAEMAFTHEDFIIQIEPGVFKIARKWTVFNWCGGNPAVTVPNPNPNPLTNHPDNLAGPIVSKAGTAAPWAPTISNIVPSDPTPTDFSAFWDTPTIGYYYTQTIHVSDTFFVAVQGKVFSDTSSNCTYETDEDLLESWTVKVTGAVTGQVVEVLTDANGEYSVMLDGLDTAATVTLVASSNFGQNCQSEYTVSMIVGDTVTQDVPVHLEQRCGLLSVGMATPRLRRCFSNRYTVQACNLSGEAVPDAHVEVSLDDYFNYTASSIPGILVSGNTYSFPLGDLAAGDCQTFTIDFVLECNAAIGATHCAEARIFPYDDCRGGTSNWSGADVEVTANCDGDSVRFAITNIGDGDMTQIQDFVVVEDVIMRQEGIFQLGIGQTLNLSQPANGSTWRLQAGEEPLHPWGGPQAVALEGCGGLNNPGLVNIFPLSDPDPFEAMDCQENIGSYDPNDKQAFPRGYGDQHLIEANTDIEYLIRFQNTGTDTAFTVVVLDTLTQHLDVASVRVGVASHPMEFALLDGGILRFTFDNILLPDSNINQAASNGFVKFRIAQKPDLTDGTLIENRAAIYFDFNDPVLTNTTFHTIGDHFIAVSTNDLESGGLLRAYPNPAFDAVIFDLKDWASAGRFELSNSLGQQVAAERFAGKQFRFERKNLPAGIYHFQIMSGSVQVAAGKVVLK
ncbi:MAG: T9SS type A sorting domain-containing protein [Saprospiraceae bacterium]